jgi:hypothetical protein
MPLIDDRGRVFGKINLIDLALLVFALLLVPLGYGAYLLFRTPPPQLLGVSPNPLRFTKGEQRVVLKGEHLRPFLRATVGGKDARNFLVASPQAAEIQFDELPPGTYDVALFDPSEQIARLANALTIAPPPLPPIQLVGRFVGPGAAAAALAPGSALTVGGRPAGEIVEIKPAAGAERPATLRASCEGGTSPCVLAGTNIEPGKPVALKAQGRDEALSFVLDEMRADGTWLDVHVRMFAIPEVLDLIKVGDVDRFNGSAVEGGVVRGAVVRSLDAPQASDASLTLTITQGLIGSGPFGANISSSGRVPMKTRMAVLRMPLHKLEHGWTYRDEIIKTGSSMAFETEDYLVRGLIIRVAGPDAPSRERTDQ